jgi:hypothetical protein
MWGKSRAEDNPALIVSGRTAVRLARAAITALLLCSALPAAAQQQRADAVLIVNSASAKYTDAQRHVQPFLDHYGVPYTILDIATAPIGADIGNFALIIIGHPSLDTTGGYLDATEQQNIVNAVALGSGLVSFDHDLSASGVGRYAFTQQIFGFQYGVNTSGSGVVYTSDAPEHWVSARHAAGNTLPLNQVASAALVPANGAKVLARFQDTNDPFVVTVTYGLGRALQWGSSAWMSPSQHHFDYEGALRGLDDLVWRGFAWAARKPFVMQGLPPFVTMRVDDVQGPMWWAQTAVAAGLKPWLGVFFDVLSGTDSIAIQQLAWAGNATASVHSLAGGYFYYDHFNGKDWDPATLATNVARANKWHSDYNIPVSKVVIPHFYEIGTNAFATLQAWGVRHVGTHVIPGQPYGGDWLMLGPWRKYDAGNSETNAAVNYADYLTVPNHPEYNGQFFDCITEIRDDVGYEWLPSATDVPGTIGNGTRQLKRALDAMTLATLFTHEYYLVGNNGYPAFTASDWTTALTSIESNIAAYHPIYVTMDQACDYVRAKHDTRITAATYDPATRTLDAAFAGTADVPTKFLVFTEAGGLVQQAFTDVPAFVGNRSVSQVLSAGAAPTLQSLTVTPASPTVTTASSVQLTATATYSDGTTLAVTSQATWTSSDATRATVSGGLVAGVAVGSATITATLAGISGSTPVTVTLPPLQITSANLPGAAQQIPYSTTLAATGGSPPYSWSADPAQLPTGLTLTANGTLGGTPTVAGEFFFFVTATDATAATATASVFLTVGSSSNLTLWPGTTTPGNVDKGADSSIEVGVKFEATAPGAVLGLRYYKSSANTGVHVGSLWESDGTLLASATFTGETDAGWQEVRFATPVPIAANTLYVASYHTDVGHYARDIGYFDSAGHGAGLLYAPSGPESNGNGVYAYASSSAFPNQVALNANYWVDVVYSAAPAPTLSGISLSPANPAIEVGAALRLKAMGAFSDGGSHDISGQVLWSSSNGTVASVDPLGLVSALAPGSSTISATYMDPSGAVSGTTVVTVPATPHLASIVVSPASARLLAGATQQFTATGYDTHGNPMTGLTFTWSAPSGGTITSGGLFTAGATAGVFAGNVTAQSGGVTGSASTETVGVASVALSPTSVTGGATSTGTVTLSGAAPSGGAQVSLSSDTAGVTVPPSVAVTAGQTSATFTVSTTAVATGVTATITAAIGVTSATGALGVNPVPVASVSVSPNLVVGGTSTTGTVTLSAPAPAGGIVVTLSGNSASATVPASVTVGPGATSATFSIGTSAVSATTPITVTGSVQGSSASATFTIASPTVISVVLTPSSLTGGASSSGVVYLTGPAPTGGAVITVSSSDPASASVPTQVTAPAGASSVAFTVTTVPVIATTSVTITVAAAVGSPRNASLTVSRAAVSSVSFTPNVVLGSQTTTGTVTLNGTAPSGGFSVSLSSGNTAAVTVPPSLSIPAGATSAMFVATSNAVSSTASVSISATLDTTTRSATLTVAPASVTGVLLTPSSVVGGASSTALVTLNGPAGPSGTALRLSTTGVASVPSRLTIPAGQSSATFTVSTSTVSSPTSAQVSASGGGAQRTATLTIAAPTLSTLSVNPTSVQCGAASLGTVTLTGNVAVDTVVTLVSNSLAASVPPSVIVAAGSNAATFPVATSVIGSTTTAGLTATLGSSTATASLQVRGISITGLTLDQTSVTGDTTVTGTVTISNLALAGGFRVRVSSTSPSAVPPSSVTIPEGQSSITFAITTSTVLSVTSATLTASGGGTAATATLTVNP